MRFVYQRPWLYDAQRRAIFDATDPAGNAARYAVIEASTKAGKTVGCMAWLTEQAFIDGRPGRHYWWVAPVYPQARIAFRRIKRGLPRGLYSANETELTITLPNGATMWFKTAEKPDNLYGEDVRAAVVDEASRCREDSWNAVRSTLTATRGPARIIGNVKGRTNWHYRMARRAEQGAPGMAYAKLTAYDAVAGGVLAAEEIEDAKRQLPEKVFRELYLAEASDDEGNPFGISYIERQISPLSTLPPVAFGIDLAKSVDWTVVIGLDKDGRCCMFERWQGPWESTVERLEAILKRNQRPALVDSTGVGDPIVERLQRKYPRVAGYTFSAQSKQRLMEGLAVAIQTSAVSYPDGPIRAELDVFEYAYSRTGVKYTAPEGFHDDCVMALALAVEQYRQVAPALRANAPGGSVRVSPWLSNVREE